MRPGDALDRTPDRQAIQPPSNGVRPPAGAPGEEAMNRGQALACRRALVMGALALAAALTGCSGSGAGDEGSAKTAAPATSVAQASGTATRAAGGQPFG